MAKVLQLLLFSRCETCCFDVAIGRDSDSNSAVDGRVKTVDGVFWFVGVGLSALAALTTGVVECKEKRWSISLYNEGRDCRK